MPPSPQRSVTARYQRGDDKMLLCFSHLRWNFVFQRPHHLMSRFAQYMKTIFWEEPIYEANESRLEVNICDRTGVIVLTPVLPHDLDRAVECELLRGLLDRFLDGRQGSTIRWYYTPMMLPFSEHVAAECVIYDCMDELANFRGAPGELLPLEDRLFSQADLVFTGG